MFDAVMIVYGCACCFICDSTSWDAVIPSKKNSCEGALIRRADVAGVT